MTAPLIIESNQQVWSLWFITGFVSLEVTDPKLFRESEEYVLPSWEIYSCRVLNPRLSSPVRSQMSGRGNGSLSLSLSWDYL